MFDIGLCHSCFMLGNVATSKVFSHICFKSTYYNYWTRKKTYKLLES